MPVFFEHLVEALRTLGQTLQEHPRLRWLMVGAVVVVAMLLLFSLFA